VTSAAEALPDDPDLLKAMLLAERAESERLRQIIRELQRHRFGVQLLRCTVCGERDADFVVSGSQR
jgi:hypothetical protein